MKHIKETVESVEKLLNKLKIDYKRHDNIVKLTTKIIPRVDGTGHLRRYSYDYYIGTGQWRSIYSDGTYNETYYKSNGIEDFLTRFFKDDIKHINKNCNTCGVELTDTNWNLSWRKTNRTQCQDCNNPNRKKHNPNRMYVNGKYVPKTHPLHKAGRYKTFEGAAFSALEGYEKTTKGYVYIINNPCWDGWIKIGMAIDAEDRCNSYQTSSPYRDYKLYYKRFFEDRKTAEQTAHSIVSGISTERNGEWFKINKNDAKGIINAI